MYFCLFQPEIPQNVGAIMRTAACFNFGVDIIRPCGFIWENKKLRRAGMDYLNTVPCTFYDDWDVYQKKRGGRTVLITPHTQSIYTNHVFQEEDILVLGRESDGVPEYVFSTVDMRVAIPMQLAMRSLNMATAAGIVASEACRQLGWTFLNK